MKMNKEILGYRDIEKSRRGEIIIDQSKRITWIVIALVSLFSLRCMFGDYIEGSNNRIYGEVDNNAGIEFNVADAKSIELTDKEKDALVKLGLTPKSVVRMTTAENGKQIIHGRFVHISDIHPDPYYIEGTDTDEKCHAGEGKAGKYGDAIQGCDSPMILMNDTIKWIEENLKDKIDFIVWTGDNIRHDNDRRFPRTSKMIFEMNQHVSDLMFEAFKNDDPENPRNMQVELIPSLGNNDVYPHNLFASGPTNDIRELFKIWQNYIPQAQLHTFNRGAYFFQEVIPNHLAILSINTLYLFQSNPLVDNCDKKKQPGYKLFEWLGYVLKEMRARNMKVWLTGHVPPNEKNFEISCLRKYILWTHEYRDIIIGGLFGHMNIDHFITLDAVAAYNSIEKSFEGVDLEGMYTSSYQELKDYSSEWNDVRIMGGIPTNKVKFMDSLREDLYAGIKSRKESGNESERYSIAHVSTSVVPTFNPGIRVWEYNITNLDSLLGTRNIQFESWDSYFRGLDSFLEAMDKFESEEELNIEKKKKKKDKTLPPKMPKGLPLGPGYIPQTFTPERYVQFYADLENINKGKKPFAYEIEYSTDDPLYGLKQLTVDEWIKFGRKLGGSMEDDDIIVNNYQEKSSSKPKILEKIWKEYLKNAFVSSDYENKNYG